MSTFPASISRLSLHLLLGVMLAWGAGRGFDQPALSAPAQDHTHSDATRSHKIQVTDLALAAQLKARGARLIGDYGGFQLLETAEFGPELRTNSQVELRDEHNRIRLNAVNLDTTPSRTPTPHAAIASFSGRRLHLVQFAGPATPGWRNALLTNGAQVVCYIPNHAYLIAGDARALAAVQALANSDSFIQWEGAYQDRYKINPKALPMDATGAARTVGTDEFAVQLLSDGLGNTTTLLLLDQLKLEPFAQQFHLRNYLNVVLRLSSTNLAETLSRIAAQADVISIQPHFAPRKLCERQDQIIAGNLAGGAPNGAGYLAWLQAEGFTQAQFDASGFVVDIADSGIDNGTSLPNHLGLRKGGTLTNVSRISYARLEGSANKNSTLSGCDGHGTLNAHLVGGYNDLSSWPHVDSSGFHYGLGVCPFVKLGSSVIFDPTSFTYPDYTNLVAAAYKSGARISNNSWGSDSQGDYTIESQTFDALVRDAQMAGSASPAAGNQGMVIVFAAGNQGPNPATVNSPGSAKNVITVGAAEGVQAFGGADGSALGDAEANNANDILSFSSRGPCADGRHKPDLMAPGSHISGGVAQAAHPATNGTALACYTGSGVSGGPGGAIFYPANQEFYTASSGTSHATPCVSGGCALLRQYFINQFSNPPSPAMTKAFLMNSARYLTGANAGDTLWSDTQGMGEMNLGMAFDGVPRLLRDQLSADLFTASGQTRSFAGTIADSTKPFRVTLAWTDAPGSTTGKAYNNDLDLVVAVGGKTYKGNVFSGAYSTTGGSADTQNNAESVFLPAGLSGPYTVTITAADINSDGVPNNSYPADQDFALVVYNTGSGPAIGGVGSTLVAEGCLPANGVIDPGETVVVNFALANFGAANTTNLTATLLATNGVISLSGPQTYGVLSTNNTAISRAFNFATEGSCGESLTAVLELRDGSASLGAVGFPFQLGKLNTGMAQDFDTVRAPALPANWTTAISNATASGSVSNWTTATTAYASAPNAARVLGTAYAGTSALVSPPVRIATSSAQLSFLNNFNFETHTNNFFGNPGFNPSTNAFDGGVLEIKIGAGTYTDILTAGGSFVTGGYLRPITTSSDNPLAGRPAWSGNSGGFITTTVNLPASAAGQTIQLRWLLATDSGNFYGSSTWFLDSVALLDGYACCSNAGAGATAELFPLQAAAPSPALLGQNLTYFLSVTNAGAAPATNVVLTDILPASATFVSGTAGALSAGKLTCSLGTLPAQSAANLTLVVTPDSVSPLTNILLVTSDSPELTLANNTNILVGRVTYAGHSLASMAGSYAGLFYDPNGVTQTNAGLFTATLAQTGSFTAKLQLAGASYSMSGKFPASGFYSNSILSRGVPVLSAQLRLDLLGGNALGGFLSNNAWTAELTANRNVYSAAHPAPQGGAKGLKYTLAIPGARSSAQPEGSGYGGLSVSAAGALNFSGVLADGTAVSQSSFVSADGQWPLFAPLYSGKGLLIGWLTFITNDTAADLEGLVDWIKPASSAKYYPQGFDFTNFARGSLFSFTSGSPLLHLTNGAIVLEGANLGQAITNALSIAANNRVSGSNRLSLTLTTSSGLFGGTLTNRLAGKAISVKGVLLQKQNAGAGFFLGTNRSGNVFLGNP